MQTDLKDKLPGLMIAFDSTDPSGYGRVITKGKKVESVIEELNASSNIKKISLCNAGVMLCKYELLFSFIMQHTFLVSRPPYLILVQS